MYAYAQIYVLTCNAFQSIVYDCQLALSWKYQAATRGDSPEWFTPPPGVTTTTVCRVSGKLATEGCQDVEVIDSDGHVERRSMIYTEYFARGTQPNAYCELHPTRVYKPTCSPGRHSL